MTVWYSFLSVYFSLNDKCMAGFLFRSGIVWSISIISNGPIHSPALLKCLPAVGKCLFHHRLLDLISVYVVKCWHCTLYSKKELSSIMLEISRPIIVFNEQEVSHIKCQRLSSQIPLFLSLRAT